MRLSELPTGESAYILKVNGSGAFRKRILDMGFVRGREVKSILNAPLHDPIKYGLMDYEVSLRRSEAVLIEISAIPIQNTTNDDETEDSLFDEANAQCICEENLPVFDCSKKGIPHPNTNHIKVALVGNPNCGKTSIFNMASGSHEHVGNYSGVTVDAKKGYLTHKGYSIELVDLPGTYSLSAYSPEELYVRKFIVEKKPDVVINVVAASALERNLYLTTELIEMEVPIIMALNMYDELQATGQTFDHEMFSQLLNIPIVPTIGKRGEGISELFDKTIEIYNSQNHEAAQVKKIPYGRVLERAVSIMERELSSREISNIGFPIRYLSIKLLEKDKEIEALVENQLSHHKEIRTRAEKEIQYIEKMLREDTESAFTHARYGFIAGGLKETLTEKIHVSDKTRIIDSLVTNKYIGFPIFILFMWIMFESTFRFGEYPMQGIEWLVAQLGDFVRNFMDDGPLKALIVDGIIGGVGGVIVFLPNIVILYAFIAFMEDSGYMARAAFIMDKLMHKMGLHGKSFIPLIMGFGCNVPAIMSTRTIESRSSRIITMLIVPFMSCSARLPVYLLFAGAFFPKYASLALLGLYGTGILLAVLSARMFRRYLFREEDTPFVMELPPYRFPTFNSVVTHMWERTKQYLQKMGGTILVASILIWFLGYFPQHRAIDSSFQQEMTQIDTQFAQKSITAAEKENLTNDVMDRQAIYHQENSYIGKIGKTIEPVMRPLGFDWKMSVSLLSGMAAKEIVISTMGVLYTGDQDNQESLQKRLKDEKRADGTPVFTFWVVVAFLLFILIYFPCVATIAAIKEESSSWKWAMFSIFYSTGLAWLIAFIVYHIGSSFF